MRSEWCYCPGERVLTFDVAAARVPCVGEMRRDCLKVRVRPDARWELFYDDIEGFTYQAGYEYSIRVARRAVADPPADGSSFAYRLVALLRKTRV